ncbi:MAG: glutathione peroxidase [bacterium]|nr:glutathione peroxidase [bacterium]
MFGFGKKGTSQVPKSIYDIKINKLDGTPLDLSALKGKKVLFVNVASKCGLTPQYEGLEKLHQEYGGKLEIIGLPCNQFAFQEPGDAEQIQSFCQKNYGVSFTITEKIKVRGKEQHDIYTWLTNKAVNGKFSSSVKWNFQKYLVSENGELEQKFAPTVEPMSEDIKKAI